MKRKAKDTNHTVATFKKDPDNVNDTVKIVAVN